MGFFDDFICWLYGDNCYRGKMVHFKSSNEAREIIDKWLKVNNLPANSFGGVLYKIGLFTGSGTSAINFTKEIVPIDDEMRTDDFIGCLKFKKNSSGAPIHQSNKNSLLLNHLTKRFHTVYDNGYRTFYDYDDFVYYVYLYKDKIKVLANVFTFDHNNYDNVCKHCLLSEYYIFDLNNNDFQIIEVFDKYFVYPYYKSKNGYLRVKEKDNVSIDFYMRKYDLGIDEIRYSIKIPGDINLNLMSEYSLMRSLFSSSYFDISIIKYLSSLIENNVKKFEMSYFSSSSRVKGVLSYFETINTTKISILEHKENIDTNYRCTVENEKVDDYSMQRVIEVTDGKLKIVISVTGQNIDKIVNEDNLLIELLNYVLREKIWRQNYKALYSQIVKNSFKDIPDNYKAVVVSILDNEKLCFEREWHSYDYSCQPNNPKSKARKRFWLQ